MRNPYFSVGEEVILVSNSAPHLNGEHVVEWIMPPGVHENPYDKPHSVSGTTFGYKLVGVDPEDTPSTSGIFDQPALRKKHKPSPESFTEMMGNIKELVTQ